MRVPPPAWTRRGFLAAGMTSGAVVALGASTADQVKPLTAQQVAEAKQLLAAQGYYPGTVDTSVTALTTCAVLAYQKANYLRPTGILSDQLLAALRSLRLPTRFTTSGQVVEVDLARQLLRIVSSGTVIATLHATTGDGGTTELARRKVVDQTPTGRFRLRAPTEAGTRTGPHGDQYRPHDFYVGGYAIYGRVDLATTRKASTHGGVAVHSSALVWLEKAGHLRAGRLVLIQ